MATAKQLAQTYVLALVERGFSISEINGGRFLLARGSESVVVAEYSDSDPELARPFQGLVKPRLVIFGGGERASALVDEARTRRQIAFHVGEDRLIWPPLPGFGRWQEALSVVEEGPIADQADLDQRITHVIESGSHDREEHQRLRARASQNRPLATYGLLGLIGLFYLLEVYLGATDSAPVLIRMGALLRWPALDGELWRLASSIFLHGGAVHVALNSYVLFLLGRSVERILGTPRFLLLFALAGLGGGLASTLLVSDGMSVGASGAIWGLLGAEAALAYRPQGILPESVGPAMKRAALMNLGLNVFISFQPHVDWAAHLGGGLVGALVTVSGLLTVGLPRLDDPEGATVDCPPGWLRPAALIATVTLVAGALYGPIVGRPWAVFASPKLVAHEFEGFEMLRPDGLEPRPADPAPSPPATQQLFGTLWRDAVLVELATAPHALADDAGLFGAAAAFEAAIEEGPGDTSRVGDVRTASAADWVFLSASYLAENGIHIERALVIGRRRVSRVDVYGSGRLLDAGWAGVAERMVRSIRDTRAPADP